MNPLGSSEFEENQQPAYPMYRLPEGYKAIVEYDSFPNAKALSIDPITFTKIRGDMTYSEKLSLVCKIRLIIAQN